MSGEAALVTAEMRRRNPLITDRAAATLLRMREHQEAPVWTYACGDRLELGDLEWLDGFSEELAAGRGARGGVPVPGILARVAAWIPKIHLWRTIVPAGLDLERCWASVPTTSREDFAVRLGDCMPDDSDLSRMICHTTSGTTGHALVVPQHPRGNAAYERLAEVAFAAHGRSPEWSEDGVGVVLVGAQAKTATYATVHAASKNSGFAKINLNPSDWPLARSAARWLEEMAPQILTGDPVAFAELEGLDARLRPRALVSTATALSLQVRSRLAKEFECPVIDWYSLNETGPIAFSCREGHLHVLPHDLHVECVDAAGFPCESGEIAVSGGRNPYLPLLRYRTGDRARLDATPCPCGDASPRLLDFQGRASVRFRSAAGAPVAPVDVARVLREFPIVQHAFVQRRDGSCELSVRPWHGGPVPDLAGIKSLLRDLFGARITLDVRLDRRLGEDGKCVAWTAETPE